MAACYCVAGGRSRQKGRRARYKCQTQNRQQTDGTRRRTTVVTLGTLEACDYVFPHSLEVSFWVTGSQPDGRRSMTSRQAWQARAEELERITCRSTATLDQGRSISHVHVLTESTRVVTIAVDRMMAYRCSVVEMSLSTLCGRPEVSGLASVGSARRTVPT